MQSQQDQILNKFDAATRRVYTLIKQAHATKKQLNRRTNFPSQQLDKILRDLSAYNLVKAIKKPQTKNQNVWVLFEQQEQEDNQQRKQQTEVVMTYVLQKLKENAITITQLGKELTRKGIKGDNLIDILEVMKLKGEIFIEEGIVKLRETKKILLPCIQCKLIRLCKIGGIISPQNCPYIAQW